MSMLQHAITWHKSGHMPLPIAPDGTKRPAVTTWKPWIDQAADIGTVINLFGVDHDGLGIICGPPSGNLEMLELEARAVDAGMIDTLAGVFADHDMADLWDTIDQGYSEWTPSGGVHWYYRVEGAPVKGNTRLARTKDRDVLIETRGHGGFTVVAPSAGRTHPDGAYRVRTGTPGSIPVLAAEQYQAVHLLASTLDEQVEPEPARTFGASRKPGDPERPGDDFNERATWDDILVPHGWQKVQQIGTYATWRKPDKQRPGISATTGHAQDADRLFVFSTSTEFEPERPYSKFGAYALLEHSGDWGKAAKALRTEGYGDTQEIAPADPLNGLLDDSAEQAASEPSMRAGIDGTAALRVETRPVLVDAAHAAEAFGPTEDGTARALAHVHSGTLRFCAQRGSWLAWNGARWEWDLAGQHRQYIKGLARGLPDGDGWANYKKRALSATGTTGIARQAESEPAFAVHIDDLDANPWQLNTPGGVVDLRTGEMSEPDPTALHTRSTSVSPDFDRRPEVFERFLHDTFGGDEQVAGFVQRILGLAAIGKVLEQMLPFAHGSGANGKSTLVETSMDALGRGEAGYAISAPAEMLMVRRHSEHPAELAQLAGARLVVCSELEDGARFAEARIKQLTGSDSINARFMRGNPFTFQPSHTIFLLGNHKPTASVGGMAFWRRIALIPFENTVPEHRRDKRLGEKLEAEAPAILAWIIRGAAEYVEGGLRTPAHVSDATKAYAADQDTVGRFVADHCRLGGAPHVQTQVSRVRDAYERFCHESGDQPVSARKLSEDLAARFEVESKKGGKGRRFYAGISLIDDDETATHEGWGQ